MTCRDLQLDQRTPFIPDGSTLPGLRDLGPVKSIPVSASDPRPRVRLVKDVLRVGQWKVGADEAGQPIFWNVTQQTLRDLAQTFGQMQANGQQVNLCYGHGDPETKIVDARDLIAPLDAVLALGDRLWVAAYVTPEQARELSNPAMQVSVRTVPTYTDGGGRNYREALLHVAVVDLPVVDGQGPFLDLSNVLDLANGDTAMADDTTTTEATGTSDVGAMDEGQLKLWERAMGLLGYTLPDSVTPENAGVVIDALLATAEEAAGDDDDEDGEDPANPAPAQGPSDDVMPEDSTSAMLANALTETRKQVRDLQAKLEAAETGKKKAAYETKLRDLATAGNINAAQVAVLTQRGESVGYDLSVLSAFDLGKVVDLSRTAKPGATAAPPAVNPASAPEELTPEEIQKRVNQLHKGFGKK